MVESFENRDLQCANEVAEMARLGKFDTEFLIFGIGSGNKWGNLLLCNDKSGETL